MKGNISVCIEAPKEKVWDVLSNIPDIHLWVESIASAHCEGNKEYGVGTVRVCRLKGNMEVKEKIIDWRDGDSFTYETNNFLMMKYAKNRWSVKTENKKTLLTSETVIILKGGFIGKLFEPLMAMLLKKMANETLAGIKYLVETGQPYKGKYSSLPKIPVVC